MDTKEKVKFVLDYCKDNQLSIITNIHMDLSSTGPLVRLDGSVEDAKIKPYYPRENFGMYNNYFKE